MRGWSKPDVYLFTYAKYMSLCCTMDVEGSTRAGLFISYFMGRLLRHVAVRTGTLLVPWVWQPPLRDKSLENFLNKYQLWGKGAWI